MPWESEIRRRLLDRVEEIGAQLRPPQSRELDVARRRELYGERDRLLAEYAENLPRLRASRCPICAQEYVLPLDDGGLDGPWWSHQPLVPFPPAESCEHARVFQGAVDLHGRTPAEVRGGILPGPGVPFVVPRLLEEPTMQAVISEIPLARGDTAYLIVYFSVEALKPAAGHQDWRRETFVLRDDAGQPVASAPATDPWDFDLAPWIGRGLLHWIAPGDETLTLRDDVDAPYVGLPGVRAPQLVRAGGVQLRPLPEGGESGYYERA